MPEDPRSIFSPRVILGIFLVIAGIFFTLDNLDLLNVQSFWKLWPVILIAIGFGRMLQPGGTDNKTFSVILILLGVVLLFDSFDLLPVDIWDFSPLLLALLGIHLIRRAAQARRVPEPSAEETGGTVNMFGFLSGIKRHNNAGDFRGGEMTAVMGGCELDLRQADIAEGPAIIDTFAFWGGIEIKVPEDWTVEIQAIPVMGGYEDKTRPPKAGAGPKKRLVVKGMCVMAGVEIKN